MTDRNDVITALLELDPHDLLDLYRETCMWDGTFAGQFDAEELVSIVELYARGESDVLAQLVIDLAASPTPPETIHDLYRCDEYGVWSRTTLDGLLHETSDPDALEVLAEWLVDNYEDADVDVPANVARLLSSRMAKDNLTD